jgi:hypothetical protein
VASYPKAPRVRLSKEARGKLSDHSTVCSVQSSILQVIILDSYAIHNSEDVDSELSNAI